MIKKTEGIDPRMLGAVSLKNILSEILPGRDEVIALIIDGGAAPTLKGVFISGGSIW